MHFSVFLVAVVVSFLKQKYNIHSDRLFYDNISRHMNAFGHRRNGDVSSKNAMIINTKKDGFDNALTLKCGLK